MQSGVSVLGCYIFWSGILPVSEFVQCYTITEVASVLECYTITKVASVLATLYSYWSSFAFLFHLYFYQLEFEQNEYLLINTFGFLPFLFFFPVSPCHLYDFHFGFCDSLGSNGISKVFRFFFFFFYEQRVKRKTSVSLVYFVFS